MAIDIMIENNSKEVLEALQRNIANGLNAINAEGHGQSGSYTVILNRTKLIIKGE